MLGNSQDFPQRSFHSPHISYLYYSPQPLWPTTEISCLLCCSVVANSKTCCGRSRNSSIVKSQGYFVLEWPFLQFHEQWAKFANEVSHLTHFFEKVVSQLPSRLMMLIRQPLKMKNGCELTQNRRYTIFEPLFQFNEAKWQRHNDVSSKLKPSVFKNSSTFNGNFKYGVMKSYGACECRKPLKNVKILWCQWVKPTIFRLTDIGAISTKEHRFL